MRYQEYQGYNGIQTQSCVSMWINCLIGNYCFKSLILVAWWNREKISTFIITWEVNWKGVGAKPKKSFRPNFHCICPPLQRKVQVYFDFPNMVCQVCLCKRNKILGLNQVVHVSKMVNNNYICTDIHVSASSQYDN